jgi:hypothetical protein
VISDKGMHRLAMGHARLLHSASRRSAVLRQKAINWDGPVTEVLTLLYLGFAKLGPSPAPARADGGVVRDV